MPSPWWKWSSTAIENLWDYDQSSPWHLWVSNLNYCILEPDNSRIVRIEKDGFISILNWQGSLWEKLWQQLPWFVVVPSLFPVRILFPLSPPPGEMHQTISHSCWSSAFGCDSRFAEAHGTSWDELKRSGEEWEQLLCLHTHAYS